MRPTRLSGMLGAVNAVPGPTAITPTLPASLTSRPLTFADVAATTEIVAACEKADIGQVFVEIEDIKADWQRPSFDLATESIVILDGDHLVAVGEVFKARRAEVYVHPQHRGRGIGSALMRWTWDVARARGGTVVGQTIPESNAGATTLFQANGYQPRWTTWMLELPEGAEIVRSELPAHLTIRALASAQDERAAFQVIEDAFNEWPDRQPSTFEDWAPGVIGRDGFEPWNLQLAVERAADGSEVVVGACHVVLGDDEGWINQIAVRPDHRGQGIARALLVHAFSAARARGATRSALSTDSRTGALGLYERVGMRVAQTFVHWARDVQQTV
jgi:mycothiol synthase